MPAKPSTNKCDKHNSMVNRHIGTAYDDVKLVAENLDEILDVASNLPYLLNYLGAYSSNPTERPNGDPLENGDYYFNTVDDALVYYDLAEDVWFTVDPQEVLNARDEAIAARDAALAAQSAAEFAQANSEANAHAAMQSEIAAGVSETNAATSEANAAASESTAAGHAANAALSESNAASSAADANASETNAAISESNAATSAAEALASENAAESSEISAANSAVSAAQSAADAEAAFDSFNDLYLGAKTEDPTEDNDGNPLKVGATYWNIPDATLLYWSGFVWDSPEESAIQAANTAIAARDDAEAAEAAAAGHELAAAASATDAATSEANAANSASSAQGSATTAGNSATTAVNAAAAASTSETNAEAAKDRAVIAETNAEDSELNAATSESNAAVSESNAATSASQAATSATNAQTAESGSATNAANAAASASAAATSESNAATSETNAATSETNAAASEAAAAVSEANAGTSEANALASELKAEKWADEDNGVEVEPGRYSAKHWAEEAESSAGDVSWKVHTRGEAEMNQMVEQVENARAASGFDQYGQHVEDGSWDAINEGLWAPEEDNISAVYAENTLHMGVVSDNANGQSEPVFAKTAIAGFISDLNFNQYNPSRGGSGDDWCLLKFPEAPNGTVIYDASGNARGTGNVNLDLLSEVDPKYGNVAGTLQEALSRASEGEIKNSDFRNGITDGWVDITNGSGTTTILTDGLEFTRTSSSNRGGVQHETISLVPGQEYTLSFTVQTEVKAQISFSDDYPNVARSQYFNGVNWNAIDTGRYETTFTASGSTGSLQIIAIATGTSKVTDIRLRRSDEEVVIDRHDVFGGEFFLEEVSLANPFVYPQGMIQTQKPSMNGITTVGSNRPTSYYSVFAGDATSRGLGVDFWAASAAEKIAMVSDKSNNIFMLNDGRVVQWRMRQRTIAGFGNGDWSATNPAEAVYGLIFKSGSPQGDTAGVQGHHNQPLGYGAAYWTPPSIEGAVAWGFKDYLTPGAYKASGAYGGAWSSGVNGECYFHVWGRVRRLNQGAFHPGFNNLGASLFLDSTGAWDKWDQVTLGYINSTLGCFLKALENSGNIGGRGSGRNDGRFFNAVYAGGNGGVNDDRLPSWDVEGEHSKAILKAIDGSFRGEERKIKWKIKMDAHPSSSSSAIYPASALGVDKDDMVGGGWFSSAVTTNPRGRKCWIRITDTGGATLTNGTQEDTWYICDVLPHPSQKQILLNPNTGTTRWIDSGSSANLTVDIAAGVFSDSTVSGSVDQQDVIGFPEYIMKCIDFQTGWEGDWIGEARGSGSNNYLSRYADYNNMSSDIMDVYNNNGSAWTEYTRAINFIRQRVTSVGTTDVGTLNYEYRAYRTKENNGRKYVLGGYQNYGNIYTTNNNSVTRGGALRESFLAIADQGYSAHFPHSEMIVPFNNQLLSGRPNGSAGTSEFEIMHPQTQLGEPGYNTQAIKAAMYPYATNREVSIAVMFNEMRWVGSYANIGVIAIEDANRTEDGVAGNVYLPNMSSSTLFTNTVMLNRKLLKCLSPFAASWNDAGWMATGCDRWGRQIYRYSTAPTGTDFLREYGTQGDLWGDRGSLWIADTTMEKFQDDNGTEVLAANHVLSKPIGYTKNKARFGTQFPGSDL